VALESTGWAWRGGVMVLLSALALAPAACKPKTNEYKAPPLAEVTVAHPIRRAVTQYLEYTGTTEPYESVELRARVAGFLEKVNFQPGGVVKTGDLLFVIDKRTYEAAVSRAKAQVLADQAAFKAAESDAKIAQELATQRAGSEIDRITKEGKRDAAAAAVEASKAALQSAQLDLEFCEVRAPIDGRITRNEVDVGNLVGAAGQPTVLATIVNSKPFYVTVDAGEDDVLLVRRQRLATEPGAEPGQIAPGKWRPVDLATADSKEYNVHGRIDHVDPALNPQTGTLRVRCRFENESDLLLAGLFVRIRIFLDSQEATVVPDIALQSDQAGRYALVLDEKDAVQVRHVQIGTLDGTMRVVTEGLEPADRLVVNGLQRARAGATVKPTLHELDAPAPATGAPPATGSGPAAPGPAK
jgi:RND family efflux transporter MFP subunit